MNFFAMSFIGDALAFIEAISGSAVDENDTFNFLPLRRSYTPDEPRFRGLHPGSIET